MVTSRQTISAIIPAFNRAHCIGRAIESVLAQTRPVDEILVVDDGSTDDIEGALKPYSGSVRWIRHHINRGAAASRNTGIANARGEYVAFLDSDDEWSREKIARQIAFMTDHGIHVSCTNFELVPRGHRVGKIPIRPYCDTLSLPDVVWGCYISPGSTLLCSREILLGIEGYDPTFERYEDWDLLLRIAADDCHGIGFLPVALARIHLGMHYKASQADRGLDHLLAKHAYGLSGQSNLARRLRAAVAFNRASIRKSEGRSIGMVMELIRSFWLHPSDHWPIHNLIFGPHLGILRRRS